jgi:hypothetical protein
MFPGPAGREQSRHDALHVAVHRRQGVAAAESDGADRRRRVGADAGQGTESRFVLWQAAAVALHQQPGAGVEVVRPRVAAEARPAAQHLFERRRG